MRYTVLVVVLTIALAWSQVASTQSTRPEPADLSLQQIIEIQTLLAKSGYAPGPVDGVIGPRIRAAIRDFEADIGKRVTGEVSDELRGSVRFFLLLRRRIELYLAALDYRVGPIDGVADSASETAIRSFQASQGLSVHGKFSFRLFDAVLRGVKEDPSAQANLCERFYEDGLHTRATKWCHAAAALGIEKAIKMLAEIKKRSPVVEPSQKLFESGKLTSNERKILERRIKALSKARELTSALLLLVMYEEFQKGNCQQLEDVDRRAKQGDAKYQFILADLFHNGLCLTKNDVEAVKWLKQSANQGYASAQHDLGVFYSNGWGVSVNLKAAAKWYRLAAEQEHLRSQYSLAEIYEKGKGVTQNYSEALKWYEKAATNGETRALYHIGQFYLDGKGVPVDFKKALKWFLSGANRGSPFSQVAAAAMYLDGLGTKRNLVEAHKWTNLASTSSIPQLSQHAVSMREQAEARMTPSQVAEAQRLAKDWRPKIQEAARLLGTSGQGESKMANEEVAALEGKLTPTEARLKLQEYEIPITKEVYFRAVETDNLNVFKLFVAAGAAIETTRGVPGGVTALYDAVDFGSHKVFRYLMQQKANVNVRNMNNGSTPLVRAISHTRWDMAEDLLEAGADASMGNYPPDLLSGSALSYALMSSNPALVRLLLQHGASVREILFLGDTILNWAIQQGHMENVAMLLKAGTDIRAVGEYGRTSVLACLEAGKGIDKDMLELILSVGGSAKQANNSRYTPLFMASLRGDPDAVALLVRYGAEPNERYRFEEDQIPMSITNRTLRDALQNGATPLMVAAASGHFSAVKTLIRMSANPAARARGELAEHSAFTLSNEAGYTTISRFLKQ